HIALELEGAEEVSFEIYSGQGDTEVVHSQGRAVMIGMGPAPKLDLASLKQQCNDRELSRADCYASFARMGLAYGPAFQGLQRVRTGRDAQGRALAVGEIALPEAADAEGYVLHPSVLDAALQASIALLQAAADKPALPFALERLDIFAALPAQATVVARHSEGSGAQAAVQKLDLDIADAGGQVCARLSGFS